MRDKDRPPSSRRRRSCRSARRSARGDSISGLTPSVRDIADRLLSHLEPARAERARLRAKRLRRPARLGTLRRTTPLSRSFGYDRGRPIDRYYIEGFLNSRRATITGHVLEVKDDGYTKAYGTNVTRSDVVDIDPTNARATITGDLADLGHVPDDTFDCFILTQTLQLIYDVEAAAAQVFRILKPGGTVLATVPVISRDISVRGKFVDYWRFTPESCRRLFGRPFGSTEVVPFGNVLASIAFLEGMACEELKERELDVVDPDYAMLVGVAARK